MEPETQNKEWPVRREPVRPDMTRRRGGRLLAFLLVAIVSAGVGASVAWYAIHRTAGSQPGGAGGAAPTATTGAQPASGGQESMPGMPGMEAGDHPTEAKGNTVYISPARQQMIGVRTAAVEHRALQTTIRTVGTLAYDETRVTEIHTKITGWLERTFVDYVGRQVRRGEPLFTVYSPDLVATQKEYLLALRAKRQLGDNPQAETRTGADSLLAATRERLKLWDITDAQIDELERSGEPRKTLTLYSPFTGVVLERNAFAGQYITPEMATYKIADLSTIWAVGQIFEYELPAVKIGQEATIQFPYGQSNRTLTGRITYIYPDINPETRRARVRIEFRNPGLEFKPETYVTVVIQTPPHHELAIPKEAVIDTGVKQYAILAHPNGYFEPREIKVGPPSDEFYPMVSGLQMGDRVVTSAQFLVDSETNLQAAMQAMSMSMPGMDMGGGDTKGKDMKGTTPVVPEKKVPDMKDMPGMDMGAPKGQPPTKKPGDHSEHQQ